MASYDVMTPTGQKAGTIDLPDAVFAADVRTTSVRSAYNQYRANQRQGTHATKTRGQVSGGGKKPYKQKGTGRARQGSTRAPQWRHGAIIFGPSPRDYSYRINRKVKRQAIVSLLTAHRVGGTLRVVDDFQLSKPRTKDFVAILGALGLENAGRILVVNAQTDPTALLSARNLPNVETANANNLNVYNLITADAVVLTRSAVAKIGELFAPADATAEA